MMRAMVMLVLGASVLALPRRGSQARNGVLDAVVARGYHVGTRSQDGNQLEHVIVVGVKYRSARELLGDLAAGLGVEPLHGHEDRKSTRLNSSHGYNSYAVFCLQKKQLLHIS